MELSWERLYQVSQVFSGAHLEAQELFLLTRIEVALNNDDAPHSHSLAILSVTY